MLLDSAARHASSPLFLEKDDSQGYAAFADRVACLTTKLVGLGAGRGSRVFLLAGNRSDWFASFFAIAAAGATAIPVNPALATAEVRAIIHHAEPQIAIVEEQ